MTPKNRQLHVVEAPTLRQETGELPAYHPAEREDRSLRDPDPGSEQISAVLPCHEPEDSLPDRLDNGR